MNLITQELTFLSAVMMYLYQFILLKTDHYYEKMLNFGKASEPRTIYLSDEKISICIFLVNYLTNFSC